MTRAVISRSRFAWILINSSFPSLIRWAQQFSRLCKQIILNFSRQNHILKPSTFVLYQHCYSRGWSFIIQIVRRFRIEYCYCLKYDLVGDTFVVIKTKLCTFTVGCRSAAGHTYGSGIAIFSARSPFDNLYIT